MIFHDDVDEVIYSTVFVSDEDFAVEDFVVAENVVDHFLIDIFGGCLEGYFHAASGFGFEVDVSENVSLRFPSQHEAIFYDPDNKVENKHTVAPYST